MESKSVPEKLIDLRDQIDVIDEELVRTLARRFAITSEVGRIKAENQLESVDRAREQEKLARLKMLAQEESLNSDFVLELFQDIFREVVKNHRRRLQQTGRNGNTTQE